MIDLKGKRFGRLTVIDRCGQSKNHGGILWMCICDCGKYHEASSVKLRLGKVSSCGCLKKNILRVIHTKHNGYFKHSVRTRLYRIWLGMRERCNYPKNINYPNYGGRGIRVCDEWVNDFAKFKEWACNNGYDDTLSIDRIDNNGDYEPSNCQWIPLGENTLKQRRYRFIEINGVRKSITNWARYIHKAPTIIYRYCDENGIEATRLFLYETLKQNGILPLIEQN